LEGKKRKAVRSKAKFGQVGWQKQKSCPKQGQVQTGWSAKTEKLSEAKPSSDRLDGKNRKAVRSRGKFGQVGWQKQQSCPKQGQVQTGWSAKTEKLSEAKPSSDRLEGKNRKAVRSRAKFGQVGWQKQKTCPKQSQVRTGWMAKTEKLSEAKLSSDRLEGKNRKAVRSKAKFGQVGRQKQKSCPKQSQVRTGWMAKTEKLSEAEPKSRKSSQKTAEQNVRLLP
jgi:hypothetical protein